MSDRAKKHEDELHLRLLEVTEDPTSQGCQARNNKSLVVVTEFDGGDPAGAISTRDGKVTIH